MSTINIQIKDRGDLFNFIDEHYNQLDNEAMKALIKATTDVDVFVLDKPSKEHLKRLISTYLDNGKDSEHPIFIVKDSLRQNLSNEIE